MDFTPTLLYWFSRHGRDLPWRGCGDAYAVWLSEIILQQTRVEQGRAYWERFLRQWPTVAALAAASEDEVLRAWQGLGYYSRARHLLAAAREVAAAGGFPRTRAELRRLPGVGDYTSAAIAAFAFGADEAAVDGNVYRVLARFFGVTEPIDTAAGKKVFDALARQLLPPGRAADYNQALMDFGATMCLPRQPRCSECPLADACAARAEHTVDALPARARHAAPTVRRITYVLLVWRGQIALHRRGAGDIWQGLWEPLCLSGGGGFLAADDCIGDKNTACKHIGGKKAAAPGQAVAGETPALPVICRDVKHQLTHRTLLADALWDARPDDAPSPTLPDGYQWVPLTQLHRYAMPVLVDRIISRSPVAQYRRGTEAAL